MTHFNDYPEQPNAPLRLVIGLHTKYRDDTQRFIPTFTTNESWIIETTLANWLSDFNQTATPIWNYAKPLKDKFIDVSVHYTVRIENVTAPGPSAGSWLQAKQNFDGQLSDLEFRNMDIVRDTISDRIALTKKLAKY